MWAVDVFVLGEANFFAALTMGGGSSIFPCESSTHFILVFFMQWLLEESRKEIMAEKLLPLTVLSTLRRGLSTSAGGLSLWSSLFFLAVAPR